jgi:hypothetical protein
MSTLEVVHNIITVAAFICGAVFGWYFRKLVKERS